MNKISNMPFYNYNVSLKGSNQTLQPIHDDNKLQNSSNDYMSSDISSASRAYGLSFINKNKTIPQISLKDMIKWLESQGKIEGKDFEIDSSCTMGNTVLTLKNKQDQEELSIHYDNGNHSEWSGYVVSEYTKGELTKQTCRDSNGNINSNLRVYNNDEAGHLLQEGLSYNTTPEEYINYLKFKNIDYKIKYSGGEDNNRSVHISILDNDYKAIKDICFYYGENKFNEKYQFISQRDYNEKGDEYRRLTFNKDNVEVITYVNYL